MPPMRALIVGLGSMGRRHLSNLKQIDPGALVTAWRHSREIGAADVAPADRTVFGFDEALETRPRFALITGPASVHVEQALALADRDVHLLIEKPLSNRLDGVDMLIDRCRQRNVSLLVGYNFRFYQPLQAMKRALEDGRIGRVLSVRAEVAQYLPDWRPGDYRRTVTAQSRLGGGVLLELSHEIDYVRWLVGEIADVSARVGRLSDLETDVEDVAEVVLTFENGAIGSIHLDMVQRSPVRVCRVVGSEGTLLWDGMRHEVQWFCARTGCWTDLVAASDVNRNEMYMAELRHFLDCVEGVASPLVNGEDGRRVLEVILAARQSSDEGRVVRVAGA